MSVDDRYRAGEDDALKLQIDALLRAAIDNPDHPEKQFDQIEQHLRDRLRWPHSDDAYDLWYVADRWTDLNEPWYDATPEELRAEMLELAETVLSHGGMKLGPDHDPKPEPEPERSWPERLRQWLLGND